MNDILQEFNAHVALEDLTYDESFDGIISLGDYIIEEMEQFCAACDDRMYLEAVSKVTTATTAATNKPGFFQKAISYIKRFFQFLMKCIKGIINFIFKRKAKESGDQIIESIVGTTDGKPVSKTTSNKNESEFKTKGKTGERYKRIHVPVSSASKIKPPDIDVVEKSLSIKIEKNDFINVGLYGVVGSNKNEVHALSKGGQPERNRNICLTLDYITNNQGFRDMVNNFIEQLLSAERYNVDMGEAWNKIELYRPGNHQWRLNTNDLKAYYKQINELSNKLNNIKENGISVNRNELVGYAIGLLTRFTMGLNILTRDIGIMFVIDARYLHTINDVETLGQFVNKMIDDGIPSNLVGYNCWCAMAEDFDNKGYFYDSDADKGPLWGQTRIVFLPVSDSSTVLKVAMNGAGRVGNKTEINRYKIYGKSGYAYVLAKPLKEYANNAINSYERVETSRSSPSAKHMIESRMDYIEKKLINAAEEGLPEIFDRHDDSYGINSNGDIVVIDYAM